jgi:hypothetical protein
MYYGNPNADDQSAPQDVWDNNFVGIWHLAETAVGSGNPGIYKDSTSNNNHGDDNVTATGKDGQINGGQQFNGNGDRVEISHDVSLNLSGQMTISFWIHPTEATSQWNRIVEKGMWGYQTAYYFGCGNGCNDLTFYLNNTEVFDTVDNVLTMNTWQHAAVSYDLNGDAVLYLNGHIIASSSYTDPVPGNADILYISYPDITYDFPGFIDEVRISNIARSADWITTYYNNTNSSDIFCFLGNEELLSKPDWVISENAKNWLYRKKIIINSSQVSSDLNNFPVLVNITDLDLKAKAQANGFDIQFTQMDGETKLDHEIESYNSSTGELFAWVKVPTLNSLVDTNIYLYYGNPAASDQANPSGVWDCNYSGVWHLKENPTNTAPQFKDSSSNSKDGESFGAMTSADLVKGIIGNAIDFDGINDHLEMPDPLNGSRMTFSAWICPADLSSQWHSIAQRDNTGDTYYDWQLYARANDAPTSDHAVFRIDLDTNTKFNEQAESDIMLSTKSWYYIVGTYNGTHLAFYKNGVLTHSDPEIGSIPDSNDNLWIGMNDVWTEPFQGIIDEIRVSNCSRSPHWIETEFNNQNSSDTFYSIEIEEGINETSNNEWVELYNADTSAVPLTGWWLSDNDGNSFNLSGAGSLPSGGYLICHLGKTGSNSSTDVYGPITNGNQRVLTMLENVDDLALMNNTLVVDYIAWGSDPGTDASSAVASGDWSAGKFVDTNGLLENQTIGRNKDSTDTNSPADWENSSTNKADPFGVNATSQTAGEQNLDKIIPEFDIIAIPILFIVIVILYINRTVKIGNPTSNRNQQKNYSKSNFRNRRFKNKRCNYSVR